MTYYSDVWLKLAILILIVQEIIVHEMREVFGDLLLNYFVLTETKISLI